MLTILHNFRAYFIRTLEWLIIAMVIGLTLTVLWGVITRFALGHQAEFTDELARVLLIWIAMLGGALAFGTKAHLGVDFFLMKLHPQARKVLSILAQVIIATLAMTVFIKGGWQLAGSQMDQILPTMPLSRGLVYAAIPLSGCLILLFALESMVQLIKMPAEEIGSLTKSED